MITYKLCALIFLSLNLFIIIEAHPDVHNSSEVFSNDDMMNIDLGAIEQQCNETYMITMEYLVSLVESGSFPDEIDITPKCFVNCFMEKLKLIDEAGTIDVHKSTHLMSLLGEKKDENVVYNVVKKCVLDKTETNICEKSYAFARCVLEGIID